MAHLLSRKICENLVSETRKEEEKIKCMIYKLRHLHSGKLYMATDADHQYVISADNDTTIGIIVASRRIATMIGPYQWLRRWKAPSLILHIIR